jgi:ABC-type nitrate/sulfonate/bicarbonate transport system permease component
MNSILTSLLIAVALTLSVVVAHETLRVSTGNGTQHVDSALHGNTNCVKLDGSVFCAPATARAHFKLASN